MFVWRAAAVEMPDRRYLSAGICALDDRAEDAIGHFESAVPDERRWHGCRTDFSLARGASFDVALLSSGGTDFDSLGLQS